MAQPTCDLTVLETIERARSRHSASADRLVISPNVVAVIDGSTPKPWELGAPFDGPTIADQLARAIEKCAADRTQNETPISWPRQLTAAVAALGHPASRPSRTRGCATVAILDGNERIVWRIGDPWVMIDETIHPPRRSSESSIARRRAQLISAKLQGGTSIAEVRHNDPSRVEILGDLQRLSEKRNDPCGLGYGAIDGLPVPGVHVEAIELPSTECEVVLATDGYPEIYSTLEETERRLQDRLLHDPLLIDSPPQTKGVAEGAESYDDRTYVRCIVGGRPA